VAAEPAVPGARFDRVAVIFNPDPSRMPVHLAEHLRDELIARMPSLRVDLLPTGFAGHARELARAAAQAGRPLIVSASGDGGYNEVVNGVMDVPDNQAVCAVLAAGNANDHRRSTRTLPLIEAILHGSLRKMDLLHLQAATPEAVTTRYAHSYIGFGLTPAMAIAIEKGGKGRLRELIAVARAVSGLTPFEIARCDGAHATFDSLVLANIPHIAKYGRLSQFGDATDGKFEVVMLPHSGTWRMALMTLRAVTVGLGVQPSVRRYDFVTVGPLPLQIDGEVLHLPEGTAVQVRIAPGALTVIG
jgi:diacylglycerol kinase (ATP)